MNDWHLKYLFIALFQDGTVIEQDAADVSVADPLRSRFYDVAQRLDEVQAFALVGEGHIYTVDLQDGHFEVDGVPFNVHPTPPGPFALVFWRDHTHTIGPEGTTHDVRYRFGWACDGNEQTLVLD